MNIADFLSESAAKRPHGIAAITKSRALSFEALEHAVWQIAMEMHQAGIGPGDAVGMLFQHQLDYLAASLAMIRIGAIQIGFSTNSTAHTLQDLSARAGIKAFLTDIPGFKSPKLPTHRPILNSFLLKTEPLDPGIRHVD
ncbi:MAG: AMP-binding protein, partial [Parvibaculum sp.]